MKYVLQGLALWSVSWTSSMGLSAADCPPRALSPERSFSAYDFDESSLFITNSGQIFRHEDPFVWAVRDNALHALHLQSNQTETICSFPFSGASETSKALSATLGPCSSSVTKHGMCIYVLAQNFKSRQDSDLVLYKMREPYIHARCEQTFKWPTKNVTLSLDDQAKASLKSPTMPRLLVDPLGSAVAPTGEIYVYFDGPPGSNDVVARVDSPFDQEHDYRLSACQATVQEGTVSIEPLTQISSHFRLEGFSNDGSLIVQAKMDGSIWTLPRSDESQSLSSLLASDLAQFAPSDSSASGLMSPQQQKRVSPGPQDASVLEITRVCDDGNKNSPWCFHSFVSHAPAPLECMPSQRLRAPRYQGSTRKLSSTTVIFFDNLDNPPPEGSEIWTRKYKKGTKGVSLYTGERNTHSGLYALLLKGDIERRSTATLETPFDGSLFDSLQVSFWYITRGFDDPSDDFFLEISSDGGSTWEVLQEWDFETHFFNGIYYNAVVPVPEGTVLTSMMKIRFRCDSGKRDRLYIDDIQILGFDDSPQGPSMAPSESPSSNPSTSPSKSPVGLPTSAPSGHPSLRPSVTPSLVPSSGPSNAPIPDPTSQPSQSPTESSQPSKAPSYAPSTTPIKGTQVPSEAPSKTPSLRPSVTPSQTPSIRPSSTPSQSPSTSPSASPSQSPTSIPSEGPSLPPSKPVTLTYQPGKLNNADRNGVRWSEGLTGTIIAGTGTSLGTMGRQFHSKPDAAGCFPRQDGKWVYASNSESSSNGGVGGIYFNNDGVVEEYDWLLDGTRRNCGGGETPWGSWISCEESGSTGFIYEVDVEGQYGSTTLDPNKRYGRLTCLGQGGGNFESVAYDGRNLNPEACINDDLTACELEFFATHDARDGELRKYTPKPSVVQSGYRSGNFFSILSPGSGQSCSNIQKGSMEYLEITGSNSFRWTTSKADGQTSAANYYRYAEGIVVRDGIMYVVSKTTKRIYIFDLNARTWTRQSTEFGLFENQPDQIRFVDGNANDLLYFTEDGGSTCGIHARNAGGQYITILESNGSTYNTETTGIAFSPNKKFMYFAFQGSGGHVYSVTRDDGLPFDGEVLNIFYS